ncbi:SUMF1/EgtB/PvdO family nonheme iron enzyme [Flavihumibacter petaseus]|uniref:Putative adenylate cyclase n=1 Tax=Flavihumibacter petaseus NBRC 106054 TaxID=1220578 RepID=A0A0E9N019_9BACT|nr:SUMF1/EgtB/PvdO family nonheme iron enzyme [Flavihumibacter petaseus]GAO43347.1 putative adenylate cyclase [Flavihumibacter petaseus NBRC 106054]
MPPSRQLAAILFADIMGYTAMMQEEEHTAIALKEKFKNKLEAELALHGGRLIKFSGDGALCSFNSALEAVTAAVNTQLFLRTDPVVPVRMGIHQADIVMDDADIYGDGVNIASRFESMAVPGSILVSGKIIDDVKNHHEIQSVLLGKYVLKNVKEPVDVYAISNPGLEVPLKKKLEGKAALFVDHKKINNNRLRIAGVFFLVGFLAAATYAFLNPWMKKQRARTELIPAIQKLISENFQAPTAAFTMATEAEKYLSKDSVLQKLWPLLSTRVNLKTAPEGAEVWWKDYGQPDTAWQLAGTTPLRQVRFPRSYLRIEIRKPGYQRIEYAGPGLYWRLWKDSASALQLDKEGSLPEGMVRIPASETDIYIVGLEQSGPKYVPAFLIDKYEVTNKAFKVFVDAGGYNNPLYWKYPVDRSAFTDKTGKPGPANWEAGTYPDGQENFPVTGISWYEAAAYAAWAQKSLPTIYHWGRVAETSRTYNIVPLSNFNGKDAVPVGTTKGYSSFGLYDLAGNAREWCLNQRGDQHEQHYILGGGWNDPTYAFNDGYTAIATDRSVANGFRCIRTLPGDTTVTALSAPVEMAFRDYKKEKPVDDKTFEIYKQQFLYDKVPLDPKADTTITAEFWRAEAVSFETGYNKERMQAWVYLPKEAKPPYRVVLFFPGSGDIFQKAYKDHNIMNRFNFLLKNGYAVVRPIFKGTFERHDALKSDLPDETVFYRDHLVMWRKDIGRTIDYLETRKDLRADQLGYLGWSWGGYMGGIMPAIEPRIKAVVLNVGGMVMNKSLPEADQLNYLPHVTQPVLMLNGRHDMFFPVETSQMPMFNFLGTPAAHKKIIIYDAGHLVPVTEFMKETLAWFDQYLKP